MQKLTAYIQLMRVDRPIGTFLLLWPTLWALWIAGNGHPPARYVAIFISGVFIMRAAGCVINDYADRNFDGCVERTRSRPLSTGELTPQSAILTFIILIALALALVLQLNRESLYVAFFAAAIAMLYPFSKRVSNLPQLVLGLAFSMSIPMAFAALLAEIPKIAWLLVLANLLWVIAYDTIYAMIDRNDDLIIGIKSSAILFGQYDKIFVFVLGSIALIVLIVIGQLQVFNNYYYGALVLAGLNLLYQQWLIKTNDNTRRLRAFLSNNWFGAFVFAGLVLNYLG